MYSIFLAEGGGESGNGWVVWLALAIFFVLAFLGRWVSQKGWLKKEDEPLHDHHPAQDHPHEPLAAASESTHPEAASIPTAMSQPDDLTALEGIGPKVAQLLNNMGITTFQQLAEADLARLREALDGAGYKYMDPAGWVEQAVLAAKGDAQGLKKLQDSLKGGRKIT